MTYKKTMYKKHSQYKAGQRSISCTSQPEIRYSQETPECTTVCREYGYPSLAMVYAASQCWRMISDDCVGFERGTIFDELNKPFMGDKCKNGGYCK